MQTVQPLLMKFRSTLPLMDVQIGLDEEMRFDSDREIWIDQQGVPLYAAPASRPYTNAWTAPRQVKGGYTKTNKYTPAKTIPGKTDKRSGK